jgi:hypothetical protein
MDTITTVQTSISKSSIYPPQRADRLHPFNVGGRWLFTVSAEKRKTSKLGVASGFYGHTEGRGRAHRRDRHFPVARPVFPTRIRFSYFIDRNGNLRAMSDGRAR